MSVHARKNTSRQIFEKKQSLWLQFFNELLICQWHTHSRHRACFEEVSILTHKCITAIRRREYSLSNFQTQRLLTLLNSSSWKQEICTKGKSARFFLEVLLKSVKGFCSFQSKSTICSKIFCNKRYSKNRKKYCSTNWKRYYIINRLRIYYAFFLFSRSTF